MRQECSISSNSIHDAAFVWGFISISCKSGFGEDSETINLMRSCIIEIALYWEFPLVSTGIRVYQVQSLYYELLPVSVFLESTTWFPPPPVLHRLDTIPSVENNCQYALRQMGKATLG